MKTSCIKLYFMTVTLYSSWFNQIFHGYYISYIYTKYVHACFMRNEYIHAFSDDTTDNCSFPNFWTMQIIIMTQAVTRNVTVIKVMASLMMIPPVYFLSNNRLFETSLYTNIAKHYSNKWIHKNDNAFLFGL